MAIIKKYIGQKFTRGHHSFIIEDTPECENRLKLLKATQFIRKSVKSDKQPS